MEGLVPPLLLVGMLLVFWLLVVRPGARRERERRAMQSALAIGDRVILTSGFFGTVRALRDDRLDVEIAPGTTVTVARGAVGGLDTDGEPTGRPGDAAHPTTLDKGGPTTPPTSTPDSEES